jgi:hypothetical protein
MQSTAGSRRPMLGVALTGLGGLLMVIGSVLPFIAGSSGGPFESQTSSGLRFPRGKVDLGIGIALLLIAFLIRAMRLTLFSARILAIVAVVSSAIVLYWSIRDVSDVARLPEVDPGTGLYFVLVGGILGLVGGVLNLIARRPISFPSRTPEQSPMPASPPTEEPPESASP